MKYKILLIIIFLYSCSAGVNRNITKISYNTSGFAYIYNETDRDNKIVSKKFDNTKIELSHSRFRIGTLIKITNPENNLSSTVKINKRSNYPEFYKILVTEALATKLKLDPKTPFVEINEIKKNKSFVAEKAKTFNEEKKIHSTAPVTNVKIDNISKNEAKKPKKNVNFLIIIGEFYSKESAIMLKDTLIQKMTSFNSKNIFVKKINKNKYELYTSSYKNVNDLKDQFINLKNYGFEELEVKIDEN